MQSHEIRSRFLEFFKKRGHTIIPSASLVTPDEKGTTNATLFNTAGMQPLVPFLLGKSHPLGTNRLVDVQKCLRTVDIDDIGDKTHATFFEMLGNWSLGDYFKKETIEWSYEFLTSKEEGLGLDPNRLYVTVFEGDKVAPRDDEAANIWKEIFIKNDIKGCRSNTNPELGKAEVGKIFYLPAANNWWEAGDNGPCGPDTEMYYDVQNSFAGLPITREKFIEADSKREVVEVWNDVFMQYEKKDGKIIGKLAKPSVDTGAGLERLAMTMQGVDNIYSTDLFKPAMEIIRGGVVINLKGEQYLKTLRAERIIADHIRSATFLISDGVVPSNTDRGYILRRLLRRAIRYAKFINTNIQLHELVAVFSDMYKTVYPAISEQKNKIEEEIRNETEKFNKTLEIGIKEFNKIAAGNKGANISGLDAFILFSSYGFPIDMTVDLAKENGLIVDVASFEKEFKKHQDLSRAGAEQKFKGGLQAADNGQADPMVIRYHTATHLLHQALYDVLGEHVMQKGSNITPERLRFDFAHNMKMTNEEKKKVEDIVNDKIAKALPMKKVIMNKADAEKTGARHFFGEKYGDEISIYFVGDTLETAYSKEFCGGPHITNTSELAGPEGKWKFKIQKEEAVAQGIRRIKAVLA